MRYSIHASFIIPRHTHYVRKMMNDIVAEINTFMMFQAEPVSQQGQHLHVDSAQQESGDVRPGIEEELGFRAQHLHRACAGDTG